MELTKEYLDQKFDQFEVRLDKKLDKKFESQTVELKAFTIEQTEELARMVTKGFDHVDSQLKTLAERLDVKDELKIINKKFSKLESVLNIEL